MAERTLGTLNAAPDRASPGPDVARPSQLDPHRWLALLVVLVAGFMDLLDVTIVNVAAPSILRDLHASYSELEWVITGYTLGFAAVLITGARLGDIFGRKRIFLIGVAGFTAASALCGAAVSPAMLIGARFFEGAMSGLMVPQILAIIHVTFRSDERGKAFGMWGGVLGSASAAGLVAGGLLVRWNLAGLGWRPIFLVNVPVGLLALVVGWVVVRDSCSQTSRRLDVVGMVLAAAGVLMLVYPLDEGRSLGWPAWIFALLAGGALVLVLFVAYEGRRTRHVGSPLVVMSLFRARAFSAGMAVWFIFWVAFGGFFIVWTLYMQVGLAWSPLRAGLTAATFAAGGAVGSGLAVQVLTPRLGRRVLMGGALVCAAGLALYAWVGYQYGPSVTSAQMVVPLLGAGFGFGLIVAPMIDTILTGVPTSYAGSASGTLSTTQQLGVAFGVAVAGVLLFNLLATNSWRGVQSVTPMLRAELTSVGITPAQREPIIDDFALCVRQRSAESDPTQVPASCRSVPAPNPSEVRDLLGRDEALANAHNFARSFTVTLWCAVAILGVVFLGLFALPRRVRLRTFDLEVEEATAETVT